MGILGALVVAAAAGACGEEFEGGAACPALCPEQDVVVNDTIIEAVSLDTSLVGFPSVGTEQFLLIASRPDTLDVRAVVRFDTLASRFSTITVPDSVITEIDSTFVSLRFDPARSSLSAAARLEVYDVDTTAADTSSEAILALFRPDRLLGTHDLEAGPVPDSVHVFLPNAFVLERIVNGVRLRLGVRVTGSGASELRMYAVESGSPARMSYDPSPDTAIKAISVPPESRTPTDQTILSQDLTDYSVVALGDPPPPPGAIASGGFPARRAFLRFDIPSRIVDSSTVLRATLMLTQRPLPDAVRASDSVVVYPQLVLASTAVSDVGRSAGIIANAGAGADSVKAVPASGDLRTFEIVSFVRQWRTLAGQPTQRALVLRSGLEGFGPGQIQFHSTEAPAELRPRLRLSYVARVGFGVP